MQNLRLIGANSDRTPVGFLFKNLSFYLFSLFFWSQIFWWTMAVLDGAVIYHVCVCVCVYGFNSGFWKMTCKIWEESRWITIAFWPFASEDLRVFSSCRILKFSQFCSQKSIPRYLWPCRVFMLLLWGASKLTSPIHQSVCAVLRFFVYMLQ